jgi:hypothetical protein
MERRDLVGGGLMAGAAALLGDAAPSAGTQGGDVRDDAVIARAIRDFQDVVQRGLAVSPELARIREQQRVFLKANQKFPDFMEVGIDVWESVFDWHVRHQQPVPMTRAADGRYVMTVMFTTLILRPDHDGRYVGFGFDAR